MKDLSSFAKALRNENKKAVLEEKDDLSREDALDFVSDWVRSIKKDFSKREDQIEMIQNAAKILNFYIDEIEGDRITGVTDIFNRPAIFSNPESDSDNDEDDINLSKDSDDEPKPAPEFDDGDVE
jgi:hypothetical protein